MMNRAILVLAALVLILAAAAAFFMSGSGIPSPETNMPGQAAAGSGTSVAANTTGGVAQKPGVTASPAFANFITAEAKTMDARNVDMSASELRLQEQAGAMKDNEINYAKELALNADAPANERILSAYLISKTGLRGWNAGRELITAGFSSSRAAPHSVDEIKNVQTKAIALMQIDELAERAKTDPEERTKLERLVAEVKDSTLQKQIQQRLRELPPR